MQLGLQPDYSQVYQPQTINFSELNAQYKGDLEDEQKDYFGDWEGVTNFRTQDALARNQQEYQKSLMSYQYANQIGLLNNALLNSDKLRKEGLEKAGMNPALMYGSAGSMGGGGQAQSGSAKEQQDKSSERKQAETARMLGQQQIGLQLQQIAAQTDLMRAEADKSRAEAQRISGTQTELDKADIEKKIAETTSERERSQLIKIQSRVEATVEALNWAQGEYLAKQTDKVETEIRQLTAIISGLGIDNKFKAATFKARMQEVNATVAEKLAEVKSKESGIQVNAQSIEKMKQDVQTAWTKVLTEKYGSMTDLRNIQLKQTELEILANKVSQELGLAQQGMVLKEMNVVTEMLKVGGMVALGTMKLGNKEAASELGE